MANMLPARIGCGADSVNWRKTEVALFPWVKNNPWIHEEGLISLGEINPEVISILLWRVVPDSEITVIGIVDIHFAGWMTATAGICGGDSRGGGDPIGITIQESCIIIVRDYAVADRVLQRFGGFAGTGEADEMIVPPF